MGRSGDAANIQLVRQVITIRTTGRTIDLLFTEHPQKNRGGSLRNRDCAGLSLGIVDLARHQPRGNVADATGKPTNARHYHPGRAAVSGNFQADRQAY